MTPALQPGLARESGSFIPSKYTTRLTLRRGGRKQTIASLASRPLAHSSLLSLGATVRSDLQPRNPEIGGRSVDGYLKQLKNARFIWMSQSRQLESSARCPHGPTVGKPGIW